MGVPKDPEKYAAWIEQQGENIMGFNTTVVILNDALHEIEKDKDFGKNLVDAIMRLNDPREKTPIYFASGNHCNPACVVETHHADFDVLIRVGGNTGEVVAEYLAPKKKKK